ncbi:MAG: DEAD/DEAH box helicase [Bacteroidetes bacterium B1(2017)]|nr:MAG: DEAD/DEAH box helicase [Bacteroidetes bacterium B1(2017)]
MTFEQLNLIEPILKALKAEGYTKPTPIQEQAIPILLQGKDLLGCAQTGTGKTAAFAIPILQLLTTQQRNEGGRKKIKALVLTPTRELAIQIEESFAAYGKFTGIKQTVIFGGVSQHSQVERLNRGIDILIATPGRLLDLMQQGYVHLNELQFFVLDEADRMLDMGFVNDVKKVIAKLPKKRHSLFFSATMPPVIQSLADSILFNPSKVEVTPASSTADTIQQSLYFVSKGDKKKLLIHLLETEKMNSVLVFTRTKHGADRVVKDLDKAGIRSAAIHGNKSQNARQNALNDFKTGKIKVLLATDIASRGIDIDELSHVINYELPNIPETYVHRIGRTGRAGFNGIAFSFCEEEEFGELKDIQKLIGKKIPVNDSHPFPLGTAYSDHAPMQAKPKKQIPPHNKPSSRKPEHKPKRHWRGRD